MKLPGPDHPIAITANPRRVRVMVKGHVIADSVGVMTLKEASYPPVFYFPRKDVEMGFLTKTDHITHCAYKGDAGYFSLHIDGEIHENAVWTYETPFPAMSDIAERVAFYPDHVEIYEIDP